MIVLGAVQLFEATFTNRPRTSESLENNLLFKKWMAARLRQ
jgi:hypothetical protein